MTNPRRFHFSSSDAIRGCRSHCRTGAAGFTLLEVLMASVAAAMILVAVYGVFHRAVKMRDEASERTRESRLRARAATTLRNDLRNALVSNEGILTATLQGTPDGPESRFPGYLKFTTTTARGTPDELAPDVQQVEYFIVNHPTGGVRDSGVLVRAVNRHILATNAEEPRQEELLPGVKEMEVAFYNGGNWASSWELAAPTSTATAGATPTPSPTPIPAVASTGGTSATATSAIAATVDAATLPQAVRVRLMLASSEETKTRITAPVEVVVPWTTYPQISGTTASSSTSTATAAGTEGTSSTGGTP